MRTVTFFIAVIVSICGQNCIAQQISNDTLCGKAYRHIIFDESDKYLDNKTAIVDSFQFFYRPYFQCRYLDEDYVLCNIIQINDVIEPQDAPFYEALIKNEDVKILDVNVKIIEYYRSRNNPFISSFFCEQLFKEEYLGEKNHGLFNYASYVDSCVCDTTSAYARLFILVTNSEIQIVYDIQENKDSVLCNINQIIDKQVYYSDILFFQSDDYDTMAFFSLSEWSAFLHRRIDKIVKEINGKSETGQIRPCQQGIK